jgi:hypothetical protein
MTRIAQLYFQLDSTEMTFQIIPLSQRDARQLPATRRILRGMSFLLPHCYNSEDVFPYNKFEGDNECRQDIDMALSGWNNFDVFVEIMPHDGPGFCLGFRGLWTDI